MLIEIEFLLGVIVDKKFLCFGIVKNGLCVVFVL